MYFVPLTIIGLSLIGIFYILSRKGRAVSIRNGEDLVYPEFQNQKQKGALSAAPHFPFIRILKPGESETFVLFIEKFFRKMRVRLMKIENILTSITNRLHEKAAQRRTRRESQELESGGSDEGREFGDAQSGQKGDSWVRGVENSSSVSFAGLNQNNTKFDEDYWLNVLKKDRQSSYPYKKLGEIYLTRQDFHEARSVLKYAFKLDPNDSETKAMIEELKGKKTRKK